MKHAILLTLAAAVATVPAILGVAGNTTFSQSIPASIPSGATVVPSDDDLGHDDLGRHATVSPTGSATGTDNRDRGADDRATAVATATSDNRGRGSDDGATAGSTKATVRATIDDKGGSTQAGGDSGGHGSGSDGGGSDGGGSGKR